MEVQSLGTLQRLKGRLLLFRARGSQVGEWVQALEKYESLSEVVNMFCK